MAPFKMSPKALVATSSRKTVGQFTVWTANMCELQHIQYSKLFVSQIRLGQAIKIGDGVLILKVKTLRTRKAGGYEKCSSELEKAKLRPEHSKVKVIKPKRVWNRFLSLPPEVRNMIYALTLPEDDFVIRNDDPLPPQQGSLTRVCKQIRSETTKLWYYTNAFIIKVTDDDWFSFLDYWPAIIQRYGRIACRNLSIEVGKRDIDEIWDGYINCLRPYYTPCWNDIICKREIASQPGIPWDIYNLFNFSGTLCGYGAPWLVAHGLLQVMTRGLKRPMEVPGDGDDPVYVYTINKV